MNSIYAYFDSFGALKERVSAPIKANSQGNARIYAYCEAYDGADTYDTATVRYMLKTESGIQWLETVAVTGQGDEYIPSRYTGGKDLSWFDPLLKYQFVWFDIPSSVISLPGTWIATVSYRHTDGDVSSMGDMTFEIEGEDIEIGQKISLDQYNYLLGQVQKNVAAEQASAVLILGPLKNINGYEPAGFASEDVQADNGDVGVRITLTDGTILTQDDARIYMSAMTGSRFLPTYSRTAPSYTYMTDPDGVIYKAQYDATNGLVLWRSGQFVLEERITQVLTDDPTTIPSTAAVYSALQEGMASTTNYLSLSLTDAQREQLETNGYLMTNIGKRWNKEMGIYFWDEFMIYLKNGDTVDSDKEAIFDGDIPSDTPNSYGWTGHLTIKWSKTTLDITKKPPWHEPLTEDTINGILS